MSFQLRHYQSYKKSSTSSIILSMSKLIRKKITHPYLEDPYLNKFKIKSMHYYEEPNANGYNRKK
jgi:hypothetical protein